MIGPLADAARDQLGPHAARGHWQDSVTFLKGIRDRAAADGIAVTHVPGCDLFCAKADTLPAAVAAARAADLIVAVFGEPQELSGEAASRAHLTLSGEQPGLLEALARTGKPIVLVLESGRPLELGALSDAIPAILMAWYPGTEGGPRSPTCSSATSARAASCRSRIHAPSDRSRSTTTDCRPDGQPFRTTATPCAISTRT